MSTPQEPTGQRPQQPGGDRPPSPGGYSDPPPPPASYPGGMPPPPDAHTGSGAVRRPGVIVVATVLWVLTGLFLLLSGLAMALLGGNQAVQDQIDDAVARSGVTVDTEQILVSAGVVLAVLGALLVIGALLLLGRSNVARILLTVLGVIAALLLLGTVIGTLIVLVAIVLQFLPAANAWFRAPRRAA